MDWLKAHPETIVLGVVIGLFITAGVGLVLWCETRRHRQRNELREAAHLVPEKPKPKL